MELKYFKGLKREKSITKRYRELAKIYHPDMSVNSEEKELFTSIMQEINSEHREVLVLLKYDALSRDKTAIQTENAEQKYGQNVLKNIASFFNFTDKQKQYFIDMGRIAMLTFYDNVIKNNFHSPQNPCLWGYTAVFGNYIFFSILESSGKF